MSHRYTIEEAGPLGAPALLAAKLQAGLVFTNEDGIYAADLTLLVDFRANESG